MINICRKAFFYEQLKLGKGFFFEVPLRSFHFELSLKVLSGETLISPLLLTKSRMSLEPNTILSVI